jgi:hypothetical protein
VQNPGENSADFAHLKYVHGADAPPVYEQTGYYEHRYAAKTRLVYGGGKGGTWLTPEGSAEVVMDQGMWGLGLGFNRWPEPFPTPGLLVVGQVPIDDTYIDQFMVMTVKRVEGEDRPQGKRRRMIDHQAHTCQSDFFTWENMKVLDKPNLTPEETKTWTLFRRWASQFYPETDPRLVGTELMDVTYHGLSVPGADVTVAP